MQVLGFGSFTDENVSDTVAVFFADRARHSSNLPTTVVTGANQKTGSEPSITYAAYKLCLISDALVPLTKMVATTTKQQ